MQAMVTLMFQWSVQTFLSTGETRCVTSKLTGTAQPGWVLQLPINGSIPLDAALEDYFFAKPLLGDDGGELGQESARLCRLPTTLVIALKRVRKVKPVVDMCMFPNKQKPVTDSACRRLHRLQLRYFCSG